MKRFLIKYQTIRQYIYYETECESKEKALYELVNYEMQKNHFIKILYIKEF